MQTPIISIITASFNAAGTIARLLNSLEKQSFREFELIVQDNFSTDGTLSVVEEYRNALPALFVSTEADNGIYDAWNKALKRVRGCWVLFLGADDYLSSEHALEKAAGLLDNLDTQVRFACVTACITGARCCEGADGYDTIIEKCHPAPSAEEAWRLTSHGVLPACHTAMFHRATLFHAHRFDTGYAIAGDYDFVCRTFTALEHYRAFDFDLVFMADGGVSTLPQTALRMRWEYLRTLHRVFPHNVDFFNNILPVLKGSLLYLACIVLGNKHAPHILDRFRVARGLPARWEKNTQKIVCRQKKAFDSDVVPLVSIIIPARNAAPWVAETLHSVLNQTMVDWECLVINDGSSDNTSAVARSFGDSRIQILDVPAGGVSAARNLGLEEARGEYTAFLDADDLWAPNALETLIAPLVKNPMLALAWADYIRFEDTSLCALPTPSTSWFHTGIAWQDLLVDNFMPLGTFCIRSAAINGQRFKTELRIAEDRDWLIRVLKNAETVHIPKLIHFYRQRLNSAVRDTRRFIEDELLVMLPHIADADVPACIKKRAFSALAFHQGVLLAKERGSGFAALRKFWEAVRHDPFYLENYIRVLRKGFLRVLPQRRVILPGQGK